MTAEARSDNLLSKTAEVSNEQFISLQLQDDSASLRERQFSDVIDTNINENKEPSRLSCVAPCRKAINLFIATACK